MRSLKVQEYNSCLNNVRSIEQSVFVLLYYSHKSLVSLLHLQLHGASNVYFSACFDIK